MILYPVVFILLIMITSFVFVKAGMKFRFAMVLGISHLMYVLFFTALYLYLVYQWSAREYAQHQLFWLPFFIVDFPGSLLIRMLAGTDVVLFIAGFALIGSAQYFLVGYLIDCIRERKSPFFVRKTKSAIVFVGLIMIVVAVVWVNAVANLFASDYTKSMAELKRAETDQERFYVLGEAAKRCTVAGKYEQARSLAVELLELAPQFKDDYFYGNALYDGHLVLGRCALVAGVTREAKQQLLLSAETPGSPTLDTFGPNMLLAKDLLEAGYDETVIEFLQSCRSFWRNEERIQEWITQINAGESLDYGPHLEY